MSSMKSAFKWKKVQGHPNVLDLYHVGKMRGFINNTKDGWIGTITIGKGGSSRNENIGPFKRLVEIQAKAQRMVLLSLAEHDKQLALNLDIGDTF